MLCMWLIGCSVVQENNIAHFSKTLVTRFKEEIGLYNRTATDK